MANWKIKDPADVVVKEFRDGDEFVLGGYRFGRRDWSKGLQCEPLEQDGFTVERGPDDPPPPPPSHESIVTDAADALFAAHVGADEVVKIMVRAVRLLGKVVVTGGTLTAGERTIAGHALNAAEWYADVLKERDRAIAAGDDPVWPAWDSAWDVIFDHI